MNPSPRSHSYKLFAFLLLLSAACSSDDPIGLVAPVAADATDIKATSFVASWSPVENAIGYQLDISSDNFVTFVTDYNSKTVTTTTETISGLTSGTIYKYRVRSFNETGVSPNSNEIEVTTSFGPVATINGVQFIPTSLTLTDTNVGFELRMKNSTHDITFRLSDKSAGKYDLLGLLSLGRTSSIETAMAWWTTGQETFYDTSGSVTVSVSGDGKISFTFSAKGESASGAVSNITNGKLQNVVARSAGTQCKFVGYSVTPQGGQKLTGSFGYDGDGRLIQFVTETDLWNFIWKDSKIIRAQYLGEYEFRNEVWTYENNLLTKIEADFIGPYGDGTFEITYTYTGGKLTKAVRDEIINEIPFTHNNIISYNGDNVSSIAFSTVFFGDVIGSHTSTYSEYDSKNNFWQLLAKTTNNPLPAGFSDSVDGELLSKNNVGKISQPGPTGPKTRTFTYAGYNAAGYPTSITEVSSDNNFKIDPTYSGCN